jgi:hypothetical protein
VAPGGASAAVGAAAGKSTPYGTALWEA